MAAIRGRNNRGLGDIVADGLAAVGITKERAQAVANALGVKDCGCNKRQEELNRLGREWLGIGDRVIDQEAENTRSQEG